MFDIGISELGVIAVVALIVIGPERLPRVARMIGTLMGRAQRYVNDVKAEVNREIELDELKKLQTQMQDAARSVQQQVSSVGTEMQSAVQDAEKSFQSGIETVGNEVSAATRSIEQSVTGSGDTGAGGGVGESVAGSEPSPAGPAGVPPSLASATPSIAEPSIYGPASSFPYTPLEEPPIPPDEVIMPAPRALPSQAAQPLRDPRAAANVANAAASPATTDAAGQPVQPSLFG